MTDHRPLIVTWSRWAVANKSFFDYYEARPFPLYKPNATEHITDDCSATSVLMCWLAGAPEPFPGAYQGQGNTESFLSLEHVTNPVGGDFVVYGEGLSLSVQHMAVVLEPGRDPLTMSHGDPQEPRFVNAIEGCPYQAQGIITYVRYLPLSPPTPPEDTVGRRLVQDPVNHGWWLVDEDRKCGIPTPTDLATLQAEGIPTATLTEAELAALRTVAWGEI